MSRLAPRPPSQRLREDADATWTARNRATTVGDVVVAAAAVKKSPPPVAVGDRRFVP